MSGDPLGVPGTTTTATTTTATTTTATTTTATTATTATTTTGTGTNGTTNDGTNQSGTGATGGGAGNTNAEDEELLTLADANQKVTNAASNLANKVNDVAANMLAVEQRLAALSQQRASESAQRQQQALDRWQQARATSTQTHLDSITTANDAYDSAVAVLDARLVSDKTTRDTAYAADTAAAKAIRDAAAASSQATWEASEQTADAALSGDLAGISSVQDVAWAAADTQLDNGVVAAESAFTSARDAARAALTSGVDAARLGLEANIAVATATRDAALTAASAARDAIRDAHAGTNYDPSATASDPAYLAAVDAANDAYDIAMSAASDGLETAIDALIDGFETAVDSANDGWKLAAQSAAATKVASITAAQTAFTFASASAGTTHQSAISLADAARVTAIQAAQQTKDDGQTVAQGIYSTAIQVADRDFADAEQFAAGIRDLATAQARSDFQRDWETRTRTYGTDTNNRQETYTERVGRLTTAKHKVIKLAEEAYSRQVTGLKNIRDGKVAAAQDIFEIADKDAMRQKTPIVTQYWVSASASMAANVGSPGLVVPMPSIEPLLRAEKAYQTAAAAADQIRTGKVTAANVAFVTQERDLKSVEALAIAEAVYNFETAMGAETNILATDLADMKVAYLGDVADLEGKRDKAVKAAEVSYLTDVAGDRLSREYAYADAAETLANTSATLEQANGHAVAAAEEVYAKAVAAADEVQSLSLNAADKTLATQLADADFQEVFTLAIPYVARESAIVSATYSLVLGVASAAAGYGSTESSANVVKETAIATASLGSFASIGATNPDINALATADHDFAIASAAAEAALDATTIAESMAELSYEGLLWVIARNAEISAQMVEFVANASAVKQWVVSVASADHTTADNAAGAAHRRADAQSIANLAYNNEQIDAAKTQADSDILAARQQANAASDSAYFDETDRLAEAKRLNIAEVDADVAQSKRDFTNDATIVKDKAVDMLTSALNEASDRRDQMSSITTKEVAADIAAAKKLAAEAVKRAAEKLTLVTCASLDYFRPNVFTVGDLGHWMLNKGLDDATNFMSGWADTLTFGLTGVYRRMLPYGDMVDANSTEYHAGQVVGAVHMFVMGGLSGNACSAGWAARAVVTWNSVGTAIAGVKIAGKLSRGESVSVFEWLEVAPAVGTIFGRGLKMIGIGGCFVIGTPVALDWNATPILVTSAVGDVAAAGADLSWIGSGFLVVVGTGLMARRLKRRNEDDEPESLDGTFRRRTARKERGMSNHSADDTGSRDNFAPVLDTNDPHLLVLHAQSSAPTAPESPTTNEPESPMTNEPTETPQWRISFTMPAVNHDGSSGFVPSPPASGERARVRGSSASPATSSAPTQRSTNNSTSPTPLPTPPKRKPRQWVASAVTVAGIMLAACCFWQGWSANSNAGVGGKHVASLQVAANPAAPAARTLKTAPIESLRPGMRVLASNPELAGQEIAPREIDPVVDRLVTFRLEKQDGSFVEWDRIESLPELFAATALETIGAMSDAEIEAIPASALFAENVDPPQPDIDAETAVRRIEQFLIGRTVEVDLAELGVSGLSTILAVSPCPKVEAETGPGRRLITAVFRHQSSNVYDIRLNDGSPAIGVTGNHPFWSEDRNNFIRADELHQGERLKKANNTLCRVASLDKQPLTSPVTVYNLEVDGQHVYHVGSDGVLVHNACPTYDQLRKLTAGTGLQAHHLLPRRFAGKFGTTPGAMLSLPLTPARHQVFTNAWRTAIPYGTGTDEATKQSVMAAAKSIYANYPRILQALGL